MANIDLRKGRQIKFSYALEATRLTGEINPQLALPITDLTLTPKVEKIEDNSGIGNLEPMIDSHKRMESVEGSWGGLLNAENIGYLLKHIYGDVTSIQDGSTGAYTHRFSLANTVFNPTFSLFYDIEGWKRSTGCQLKTLKIDASEGGEVKYTAEFLGIEEGTVTSKPYTIPNVQNKLTASNMVFKVADDVAGLASGVEFKILNLSVSLDRGTVYDESYNDGLPNDVLQNGFVTEITTTLKMRQDDFYNWFKNKTNKAISIKFGGQNLDNIGSSSTKPSIEFILANACIFDYTRGISLDEYITFDVTLKPEYSITDGFSLETELTNGVTSY